MDPKRHSRSRSIAIGLYWGVHALLGVAVVSWSLLHWQSHDHLRFVSYLLSAAVASFLKVRLPGVTGAASVSFLFVLIGIVDLSLPEAIAIAGFSMLTQCYFRTERRPKPVQVGFNVASSTISVSVSALIYGYARGMMPEPLALGVLATAYHFANTFPVAGIIALTESLPAWTVFTRKYAWLLAYYAGGTSLAWMIGTMPHAIQWEVPIICLPVVYLVHRSYRTYLVQMEQEKKHVEQVNGVHMRTIEALALAIDAKDHTTHNHLQRVQLYALEIGTELGLNPEELDALRAASMLHDIGKLAVPEHIISKPGKLTPAEFQKMKIHPVVGAEILERVSFPYPVVPIVRSHHEKWDGSGYPDGLSRREIPIGARILSVVDCFDALASDRQYRRALPVDEAIAKVVSEAGTSFDPDVVEVLQRRYRDLECRARELSVTDQPALSTDICVTRGAAPAAGFATEIAAPARDRSSPDPGSARLPARTHSIEWPVLEGFSTEELLAIAAVRAKAVVAYDAIAFYSSDGEVLQSEFVAGPCCGDLVGLRIPLGRGLAGWVAEARKPIINGNPAVEAGFGAGRSAGVQLQSALAIPIDGSSGGVGVLAVYRLGRDAFSGRDVAALAPLCRSLGHILENTRPTQPHSCSPRPEHVDSIVTRIQ
jgi:putative nucleotidyltransferase with HDIG domain